ncbi:DUF2933 domain-containing protein [Zobellella iuensis]|uniref:DUF2933 domain-containing protein n=1 Tax=Zobellella iuensis TaxID=2803811 RepID=A0ABS1QVJ9_9GAMM|nr:DUF2933 domain-containing protein [Zobellella iuensis]MBL1378895.1 DUF2933 domain-containing protein [Zobellella iuensis]
MNKDSNPGPASGPRGFWLILLVFAAVALFFLWQEHRAHLLGALPYLIILLCPLMHLFMHRGHGGGGGDDHHHKGD